jgi:hypothetical protein
VRQGDPLSPLLFVATAELLQVVINNELREGRLSLPFPYGESFLIIQYADDTIPVMQANPVEVAHLKNVLIDYATSTGLKINFQKFNIVPLNISEQRALELANIFVCAVVFMPFTYLCLPMGTTKPTVIEMLPLIDIIERRVSNTTLLCLMLAN